MNDITHRTEKIVINPATILELNNVEIVWDEAAGIVMRKHDPAYHHFMCTKRLITAPIEELKRRDEKAKAEVERRKAAPWWRKLLGMA